MKNTQMAGRAIALFAAVFYGANTALSRLAYDAGTNPVSLTFYRFLMSAALMVVLILLLRKPLEISPGPIVFCICAFGTFATSIGKPVRDHLLYLSPTGDRLQTAGASTSGISERTAGICARLRRHRNCVGSGVSSG
jgi:hypothetical protein